jgi:flagellar motor switch protein FliM
MSELLSQEEIDALLGVFDEETEQSETIIKSDLLNPAQLQVLQELQLELASDFTVALNALLRGSFVLSLLTIEAGRAGEERPENECYVFALTPYTAANRICIENGLALSLLERLLGGEGRHPLPVRPLSAMEKLLFERFWQLFRDGLNVLWQRREAVNVMPVDSIKAHEQQCVRAVFEIVSEESSGILEIVYDAKTLRGLLGGIGTDEYAQQEEKRVLIEADLGTAYLADEEIAALRSGDIIPLEYAKPGMARIYIDGHLCWMGEIAARGTGPIGVQITKKAAENKKFDAEAGKTALRVRIGTARLQADDFMQLQYDTPIILEEGEALELIADHKLVALGKGIMHKGNAAVEIMRMCK